MPDLSVKMTRLSYRSLWRFISVALAIFMATILWSQNFTFSPVVFFLLIHGIEITGYFYFKKNDHLNVRVFWSVVIISKLLYLGVFAFWLLLK